MSTVFVHTVYVGYSGYEFEAKKKPCTLFTEEVIALFTLQTIRSRSSDFLSREKKVKGI